MMTNRNALRSPAARAALTVGVHRACLNRPAS